MCVRRRHRRGAYLHPTSAARDRPRRISDCASIRDLLGPRAVDKKYVKLLQEKTLSLIEANLGQVKRVSKALLRQRRLLPSEVRAAYDGLPLVALTGA